MGHEIGPVTVRQHCPGLTSTRLRRVMCVADSQLTLFGPSVTKMGKKCPKCGVLKPRSEWPKNKGRPDGLGTWCSSCSREAAKVRNADPEYKAKVSKQAAARWANKSPEEKAAYIERGILHRRKTGYHLKKNYGITIEDYEKRLEGQGGGCAICGAKPKENRRLAVDHDHSCCPGEKTCGNCLRGLLCTTCNVWLGFYENEKWTKRAEEYLSKSAADREIQRLEKEEQ